MPLSIGSRLGSCESLAPIGSRGMREVFRARDPKLARDEALRIAKQITDALKDARKKGVIHRDLQLADIKLAAQVAVELPARNVREEGIAK